MPQDESVSYTEDDFQYFAAAQQNPPDGKIYEAQAYLSDDWNEYNSLVYEPQDGLSSVGNVVDHPQETELFVIAHLEAASTDEPRVLGLEAVEHLRVLPQTIQNFVIEQFIANGLRNLPSCLDVDPASPDYELGTCKLILWGLIMFPLQLPGETVASRWHARSLCSRLCILIEKLLEALRPGFETSRKFYPTSTVLNIPTPPPPPSPSPSPTASSSSTSAFTTPGLTPDGSPIDNPDVSTPPTVGSHDPPVTVVEDGTPLPPPLFTQHDGDAVPEDAPEDDDMDVDDEAQIAPPIVEPVVGPAPAAAEDDEQALITELWQRRVERNRIPCIWSGYFGGECPGTSESAQSACRHLLCHIPDINGRPLRSLHCLCSRNGNGASCRLRTNRISSFPRHYKNGLDEGRFKDGQTREKWAGHIHEAQAHTTVWYEINRPWCTCPSYPPPL